MTTTEPHVCALPLLSLCFDLYILVLELNSNPKILLEFRKSGSFATRLAAPFLNLARLDHVVTSIYIRPFMAPDCLGRTICFCASPEDHSSGEAQATHLELVLSSFKKGPSF